MKSENREGRDGGEEMKERGEEKRPEKERQHRPHRHIWMRGERRRKKGLRRKGGRELEKGSHGK